MHCKKKKHYNESSTTYDPMSSIKESVSFAQSTNDHYSIFSKDKQLN